MMPLVAHREPDSFDRLCAKGQNILGICRACHQNIRKLRIGLPDGFRQTCFQGHSGYDNGTLRKQYRRAVAPYSENKEKIDVTRRATAKVPFANRPGPVCQLTHKERRLQFYGRHQPRRTACLTARNTAKTFQPMREKTMTKPLITALAALLLTACARGDTTAAVGKHNLSKGTCTVNQADGRKYKEEMTQSNCHMVGGKFTPRNRKKIIWF